jgi:hypothetical protein
MSPEPFPSLRQAQERRGAGQTVFPLQASANRDEGV